MGLLVDLLREKVMLAHLEIGVRIAARLRLRHALGCCVLVIPAQSAFVVAAPVMLELTDFDVDGWGQRTTLHPAHQSCQ
jgi:hypothetical protein